jgi:hypothetical protein
MQFVGGLRGMGYCEQIFLRYKKQVKFVRITASGMEKVIHTMLPLQRKRGIQDRIL